MQLFFVFLALLCACTRVPLKDRSMAMRSVSAPSLSDDLGLSNLVSTLEGHATFLGTLKAETVLKFGKREISVADYTRGLAYMLRAARVAADEKTFYSFVENDFEFFEVYGNQKWGEILLTSYYEPEIEGALHKSAKFSAPLLKRPDDLIEVASSRFEDRLVDAGSLRGRLWRDDRKRDMLIPYYSRAEIENGALKGRGLELCWVDPIDSFFMQVQGSGTILLPEDRRLRLGYSDQNGQMYHSIGKFLTQIIPLEKMSLFTIETYLRSISPLEAQGILNRNPSYVFFEKIEGAPRTSLGNPVFAGRTLATDNRYFPKGALAFLQFKKPVFDSPSTAEPKEWETVSRFVLDQDTGGAIRGGGRADLFWGSGDQAKRYAGFVKDAARLYYLLPKAETLAKPIEDQFLPPPQ